MKMESSSTNVDIVIIQPVTSQISGMLWGQKAYQIITFMKANYLIFLSQNSYKRVTITINPNYIITPVL